MKKRLPALLLAAGLLLTPSIGLARDRYDRYEHHRHHHFSVHFWAGPHYYRPYGYYGYGYYDRWGRWHPY